MHLYYLHVNVVQQSMKAHGNISHVETVVGENDMIQRRNYTPREIQNFKSRTLTYDTIHKYSQSRIYESKLINHILRWCKKNCNALNQAEILKNECNYEIQREKPKKFWSLGYLPSLEH